VRREEDISFVLAKTGMAVEGGALRKSKGRRGKEWKRGKRTNVKKNPILRTTPYPTPCERR
jgi:hypothetical protein